MFRDFWHFKRIEKNLSKDFSFVRLSLEDAEEVGAFLREHYVRDPTNTFAIAYTTPFIQWILEDPGAYPEMQIGIRSSDGELIATVSGTRFDTTRGPMGFGNLLCVHRDHRQNGLVLQLANAIVTAGNANGLTRAIFTTGVRLRGPIEPVVVAPTWHRVLIPFIAHHTGLRNLKARETNSRVERLFSVAVELPPNWRPIQERDIEHITSLVNARGSGGVYRLHSVDEARYRFLPRKDLVHSYTCDAGFGSFVTTTLRARGRSVLIGCAPVIAPFSIEIFATLLFEARLLGCASFVANEVGFFDEGVLTTLKFERSSSQLNYYVYGSDDEVRPTEMMIDSF